MRKITLILMITVILYACNYEIETPVYVQDTDEQTNDFYDNEPFYELPLQELFIEGEIENPGIVEYNQLPIHSLIVKETVIEGDSNKFIGAYRYDGYSLYDIMNVSRLEKLNEEAFPPIIDAYIEIENDEGETVIFSWGEIFYPSVRHQIIIAARVMMIKPSKTKDEWPLPESSKIVVATDLLTERNIYNPVKITVKSYDRDFEVTGRDGAYSPEINIVSEKSIVQKLTELPADQNITTYPTIFYGRGRGIHSITPFEGVMLKNILANHFIPNQANIREGIFIVAAKDGYRTVYTYSEIMNRNDQSEVLLVDMGDGTENGKFRLFPAADFFSDRAIFAVEGIYFDDGE